MSVHFRLPLTLPSDHLGLYVHIPYCVRKCRYCDFASRPLAGAASAVDRYLDALIAERELRQPELDRPFQSIFIGGGTPTALNGRQLRRLWAEVIDPLPRTSQAEITLEANPGTLTADVVAALAEIPLTRMSLGAQSFNPEELARLGRIHSPEAIREAVHALREIGVPHINLDLIYALPAQTAEQWVATLQCALALQPDHLSCYALIIEQETPISEDIAAGILPEPSEEEEERMMAMTATALADAGYHQYEVSNAARSGCHCRHNLGYWLGRDYLGLGASAASAHGALRWRNEADAARYTARLLAGETAVSYAERLSAPARLLERVMLGLRLVDGFDLRAAEDECACTLHDVAGATVTALCDERLLQWEGPILRLTSTGYPLANLVVSRLMAAHGPCSRERAL